MKKKRLAKNDSAKILAETNSVRISEEINGQLFFEIGNEITTDISEAVAILMRTSINDDFWRKELPSDFIEVDPKKCLYWLTGGDSEWISLQNYNKPWSQCMLDFQEEFGFIVVSIIEKSKTYGDIRNRFLQFLNLPTLYEFALSQDLVK